MIMTMWDIEPKKPTGVQKRLIMPSKLEKNIKLRHGFIKFTDSIQGDVIRFLLRWSLILVTAIPRLIAEGGVTFETHHRAHFATALGGKYISRRKVTRSGQGFRTSKGSPLQLRASPPPKFLKPKPVQKTSFSSLKRRRFNKVLAI